MTCCPNEDAEGAAPAPLIAFDHAAVRVGERVILRDTCWEIRPGQHWAVLGPNGSGKSSLVRAAAGDLPVVRGRVTRNGNGDVRYVSFEQHRRIIAREESLDHARHFSGRLYDFTTVAMVLDGKHPAPSVFERFGIRHLMNRPIRYLSTGEIRKVLIARALADRPKLLILDEPFDGLDAPSRRELHHLVAELMADGIQIILVTHRSSELPEAITHVLRLENCRVSRMGPRNPSLENCFHPRVSPPDAASRNFTPAEARSAGDIIIEMRGVSVTYGEARVIDNLFWTVRRGENWAVLGPNGAGKTSLLRLISADHLHAYANDIRIFGKPRGGGESIWEIKRNIGLVSSEFQIRYRKPVTALETVVSGFFDSVGLYRNASRDQRSEAMAWLERLGMAEMADVRFDRLSCGQQRMVLLVRAMVKQPLLLILDEPCQGLDASNRQLILNLLNDAGCGGHTQLIQVTHHPDEIPSCTTHLLRFVKQPSGGFRIETGSLDHGHRHSIPF